MTASPTVLDSDLRYLDRRGNLMRTRTELSVARMLSFLGHDYEYGHEMELDGRIIRADFKTDRGIIQVIDGEEDIARYRLIKEKLGERVMAIGHPKYSARIGELEDIVFYDQERPQTGSIFMEDQSFAFDYTHILPLVEKCSILHGHTSSVMVELIGQMENNLLMDFGEAKRIIKGVIAEFDHKFLINAEYAKERTESHYTVSFEGPKGAFELRVPRDTTFLLDGEATVENLSIEIIRMLEPRLPENIEAVGVYIYEGYNKGSHIISSISKT